MNLTAASRKLALASCRYGRLCSRYSSALLLSRASCREHVGMATSQRLPGHRSRPSSSTPRCRDPGGSPHPVWARGLGGCPHQALADPSCLLGPHQVSELVPPEELCCSQKGFPRGLQSSRSWEMAPWLVEGDLVSPSSCLCSWGDPTLRKLGCALAHTAATFFPAPLLSFDSCTLATLCGWSLI